MQLSISNFANRSAELGAFDKNLKSPSHPCCSAASSWLFFRITIGKGSHSEL